MPTFDVDFEVYCAECGAGLCNQSETGTKRGVLKVEVAPCKKCLENEAHEAVQKACYNCDK